MFAKTIFCLGISFFFFGGGGGRGEGSTLVRAAMDSDEEIFLTQNILFQEPFSPELNLEELSADFREVSERDSVEVEKKENPGRNIVVVCNNEVEQRRESRIPTNTKVNTS